LSIYGSWNDAVITIATDDDLSAAVDLGNNYEFMQVILPTLTSSTVLVHVCDTSGGTYTALGNGVATAATTGAYATTFRIGGYQYIKIATGTGQASNRTIKVRGFRM